MMAPMTSVRQPAASRYQGAAIMEDTSEPALSRTGLGLCEVLKPYAPACRSRASSPIPSWLLARSCGGQRDYPARRRGTQASALQQLRDGGDRAPIPRGGGNAERLLHHLVRIDELPALTAVQAEDEWVLHAEDLHLPVVAVGL